MLVLGRERDTVSEKSLHPGVQEERGSRAGWRFPVSSKDPASALSSCCQSCAGLTALPAHLAFQGGTL